ncbi:uncharacterized protein LOC106169758 [Lingula anatina]|uniref:Uncharacterized protein LOC106169758 n=1 Tax=Lingula anatina TaxID=7574 RepID=A0A1S3J333_LINAN|nr:uncharacterized protein LOC106169758 [Lingula anatina]|eukprot:XP_013404820.1 uncharacterized protein LOC106169758 [Lingula anatina]
MAIKNVSFLYYLSENNESSIQHFWHLQQEQSLLYNITQLSHLVGRYPWTSCALLSGTSTDAILGGELPAFKNYMDLLGTPILVIVGIILNLLAFIVLHHKDFRDSSTMFFMAMLAFSNVMTLSLMNGIGWLVEMTGSPSITAYHDSICKIWQLILRVIPFSSIWFIVAMIIDQYITLKYGRPKAPQQRGSASLCMPRLVTVSIYVGMTVINIHAMWLFEVLTPRNMCQIPSEHDAIYVTAWNWVSATTSVYLPILLLIIFTFILIVRLCHFKETGFSVEDWKVCRATVIVSGVFLLLCLPPTVINILQHTLRGPPA